VIIELEDNIDEDALIKLKNIPRNTRRVVVVAKGHKRIVLERLRNVLLSNFSKTIIVYCKGE